MNPLPIALSALSVWRRAFILAGEALLSWFCLFWIHSPSERFHALLVPLWVTHFLLSGRRFQKLLWPGSVGLIAGLFFFYGLGSIQASQMSSHLPWWEPFQKLYFTLGLFVLYSALCALVSAPLVLIPSLRAIVTSPRGWWLRMGRMTLTLLLFLPYFYVTFNLHRFKYVTNLNPKTSCALSFQDVRFKARDGVSLMGWFIPYAGSRRTIVVVHGIGSNRGDMLSLAPFLHRAGYNVLLFDLRSHGESEGHTTTFGVSEARDVEAAVDWASHQTGKPEIGVLAYSMGGSSVLHAIGETGLPQVRSVVLDSTFAEFAPVARHQLAFLSDKMAAPVLSLLSFYTWLEIGVGLNDIAPRRYIDRISPRPLLLIHGTSDTLIPPTQANLNFASARQPKTLHWIEGAGHCAGHRVEGTAYEKRLTDFFARSLKRNSVFTRVLPIRGAVWRKRTRCPICL